MRAMMFGLVIVLLYVLASVDVTGAREAHETVCSETYDPGECEQDRGE